MGSVLFDVKWVEDSKGKQPERWLDVPLDLLCWRINKRLVTWEPQGSLSLATSKQSLATSKRTLPYPN